MPLAPRREPLRVLFQLLGVHGENAGIATTLATIAGQRFFGWTWLGIGINHQAPSLAPTTANAGWDQLLLPAVIPAQAGIQYVGFHARPSMPKRTRSLETVVTGGFVELLQVVLERALIGQLPAGLAPGLDGVGVLPRFHGQLGQR